MCLRNIYQHYIQGYIVRVRVFNATFTWATNRKIVWGFRGDLRQRFPSGDQLGDVREGGATRLSGGYTPSIGWSVPLSESEQEKMLLLLGHFLPTPLWKYGLRSPCFWWRLIHRRWWIIRRKISYGFILRMIMIHDAYLLEIWTGPFVPFLVFAGWALCLRCYSFYLDAK